jgi:hypothetical protein
LIEAADGEIMPLDVDDAAPGEDYANLGVPRAPPGNASLEDSCFVGAWRRADGSRGAGIWDCDVDEQQLLDDATALHDTVYNDPDNPTKGEIYKSDKTTVAVGIIGGEKVWASNNNRANPRMVELATAMGYKRVSGVEFVTPGLETHAEQILMNSIQDGTHSLNGRRGIIAASRPSCRPYSQDCSGRAWKWAYPYIDFYGQRRIEPWGR